MPDNRFDDDNNNIDETIHPTSRPHPPKRNYPTDHDGHTPLPRRRPAPPHGLDGTPRRRPLPPDGADGISRRRPAPPDGDGVPRRRPISPDGSDGALRRRPAPPHARAPLPRRPGEGTDPRHRNPTDTPPKRRLSPESRPAHPQAWDTDLDTPQDKPLATNRHAKRKIRKATINILALVATAVVALFVFAMRFDGMFDRTEAYSMVATPTPVPTPTPQPANTRNITALITNINTNRSPHTVTLMDISNINSVELSVLETTSLLNRQGTEIAFPLLSVGNMIEAAFDPDTRELFNLRQSITRDFHSRPGLRFDTENNTVTIGNDVLNFTENTLILYRGNPVDISEITPNDTVTIIALQDTIWLIEVEAGHGFLELTNVGPVQVGMMILVPLDASGGNRIIALDTIDGPISLPEGRFSVSVEGRNIETYTTEIEIEQGETTTLDLSNIDLGLSELELTINPSGARVFVNGVLQTADSPTEFEFGSTLEIRAERDGYYTYQRTVEVTTHVTSVIITMTRETPTTLTISSSPPGAQVWVNQQLVGAAPVTVEVEPGRHHVSAYAPGFETYSSYVDVTQGVNTHQLALTQVIVEPTPAPDPTMPPAINDPQPPVDDPFLSIDNPPYQEYTGAD